jgi:hypothetical protein
MTGNVAADEPGYEAAEQIIAAAGRGPNYDRDRIVLVEFFDSLPSSRVRQQSHDGTQNEAGTRTASEKGHPVQIPR